MTNNLERFLNKHYCKDGNFNYTKIKSSKLNISGGTYSISPDNIDDFYNIYKKHVFIDKKQAYLTEKQLDNGAIAIDLDFRYDAEIEDRQHDSTTIKNLVEGILNYVPFIKQMKDDIVTCYIFEKKHVNTQDERYTKDGIHIIINISMDYTEKKILRSKILISLGTILSNLPLINSYEEVIDDGVMMGKNNWQLYGSRKPGNEPYELTHLYEASYDSKIWNIKQIRFEKDYAFKNFDRLSVRNEDIIFLKRHEHVNNEYNLVKNNNAKNNVKTLKSIMKNKRFYELESQEEIDDYLDEYLSNLTINEDLIKQAHEYSMILDGSYYMDGSYNKWIRLGMALKITSNDLFISWLKISSKKEDFDYNSIKVMYESWCNFNNTDGLTIRSIIYWAKESNPKEFYKILNNSIQKHVAFSFKSPTDYDIASVLHQAYKDVFICVSIKKNIWYQYENNKWIENDSGTKLRNKLSNEIYKYYSNYYKNMKESIINKSDEEANEIKIINKEYSRISEKIKTSSAKNNIMQEAKEIFFDGQFFNKLDSNPWLLGCNNGVIDFKNNIFRKGLHDDYISLSTNIDYKPISEYDTKIVKEIEYFFETLFPEEELRTYMWEHLASTLIGINYNQTFNIYIGKGANGKSKLIDLMGKVLGDYKGTVPITLITQKRNSIGSTSSEVAQLVGKRFAVMQEPSKGDKINEGIMKEITGGDPIQCRALFKDSITFTPQFTLSVCTNELPEIKSTDDGTWRRIRVCDFLSKFVKDPYNNDLPKEEYKYQYKIDHAIDSNFDIWAPVLLSMLTNICFKTKGRVNDTPCVNLPTNRYREDQDYCLQFCNNNIIIKTETDNQYLKITDVKCRFEQWYISKYLTTPPNIQEIKERMEKKYGIYKNKGWKNIQLTPLEDDD